MNKVIIIIIYTTMVLSCFLQRSEIVGTWSLIESNSQELAYTELFITDSTMVNLDKTTTAYYQLKENQIIPRPMYHNPNIKYIFNYELIGKDTLKLNHSNDVVAIFERMVDLHLTKTGFLSFKEHHLKKFEYESKRLNNDSTNNEVDLLKQDMFDFFSGKKKTNSIGTLDFKDEIDLE